MAFEALGGYVAARQHAWIDRAMRFVASRAAFGAHRRVFKTERAALIGMALVAAWFIRSEARGRSGCFAVERAVGIVAIGTVQLSLQHLVREGF